MLCRDPRLLCDGTDDDDDDELDVLVAIVCFCT